MKTKINLKTDLWNPTYLCVHIQYTILTWEPSFAWRLMFPLNMEVLNHTLEPWVQNVLHSKV